MDFQAFRNSDFFDIATTKFSLTDRSLFKIDVGVYDTSSYPIMTTGEIDSLTNQVKGNYSKLTLVSLHRVLRIDDDFIPIEFRREIASQWREITDIIDSMGVTDNAVVSVLIMCPPGTHVPCHKHNTKNSLVKDTITFCYSYDEEQIEGTNQLVLHTEQGLRTYPDPSSIIKVFDYPESHKTYFHFDGLTPHSTTTSKWRFFWVNDFDCELKVPQDMVGWYHLRINKDIAGMM